LIARHPSEQSDVNCATSPEELQQARFQALSGFRAAIVTSTDYPSYRVAVSQYLSSSPNVMLANPLAGEYRGLELALEYLTVLTPALNRGYIVLGPGTVNQATLRYYPSNSTMAFTSDISFVGFKCRAMPSQADPDGDCELTFPGRSHVSITFDSCQPTILTYLVNYDDFSSNVAIQGGGAFDTCLTAMNYCTGSNQVYTSIENCLAFLDSVPYVSCEGLFEGNSKACRFLHSLIAKHSPSMHCPHLGPNSVPCSDDTCLKLGQSLLCDDYPRGNVRHSLLKPSSCEVPEPELPEPYPDSVPCSASVISVVASLLPLFFLFWI